MDKSTLKIELSIEDINVILEALGALPFSRVFQIIGRIQAQAREQIERSGANE